MALKDLIEKIDITNTSRREIDALTIMLKNMLSAIGDLSPQNKPVFVSLGEQMEQEILRIRGRQITVVEYFSGTGPMAKRLSEHATVMGNMLEGLAPTSAVAINNHVLGMIDMFNFYPKEDPVLIEDLQTFSNKIEESFRAGTYKNTKPSLGTKECQLAEANTLGAITTGIYGEGSNSGNLVLALKSAIYNKKNPEKYFIVLLLIKPVEGLTIWYYHPFESLWMNSKPAVWLDGVKEALEVELSFAFNESGRFVNEFDFVREMEELSRLSEGVFNREDILPNNVSVVNGYPKLNVQVSGPGSGCFTKATDYSHITIQYDGNLELTFMNTKGAYPSRETRLITNLPSFITRVDMNKLDKSTQVYIVQVANQVLKGLSSVIDSQEGATA